jgi:penicillin G amidase
MPRLTVTLLLAALALACSSSDDPFAGVRTRDTISAVHGLSARVNVLLDGAGVPHVYASSDGDAAFAVGYLHARDRFFQMDFLRKAARGRSGELLGAIGLRSDIRDQDIFVRTMMTSTQRSSTGSHHVEEIIAEQLPADLRTVAERYRDGVNLWLDHVRQGRAGARLHPQYTALALTTADVAPWTVEDSIAIGRLQSLQLSDTSLQEATAAQVVTSGVPAPLLADLTRHAQAVPTVILNSPPATARAARSAAGVGPARPPARASAASARTSLDGTVAFLRGVRLPFAAGERAGSNNWTLAPSRTAGAHVLVANDPHLTLSNPPNFYMVHVVTPSRNVAGVTFPGTPVVVIGHNDRVAWGDTVVGYDVTDLWVEQVDPTATPPTALFKGAPRAIEVVTETRKVKGLPDDTYPIFLVPGRGPILPGSLQGTTALSVRWTGMDPSFELKAFHDLEAAKSVADAFEAVKSFGVGAQNFVFGDTGGHIGYYPHALVPIRGTGTASGCVPWLPMDGTTDQCDWTGFVSDADLPQARDPSKGYIATANNDVTGVLVPPGPGQDANPLAAPHYLYAYDDIGFREQRIQERLEASSQHTLDGMTSLQSDKVSKLAQTMMPGLLKLAQGGTLSAGAQAAVTTWTTWDFTTPRGDESGVAEIPQHAAASAAFHAFLGRFARAVLVGRLGADLPPQLPEEQSVKILVGLAEGADDPTKYPLAAPAAAWCGGDCGALVRSSLEDTVGFLAQKLPAAQPGAWRWGDLHHVVFQSPLRPLLPDFPPTAPGFPNDGGLFTVDVANFDLFADSFEQHSGPNVRIATELDPAGVRSRMVIPGGQVDRPAVAGDAADAHYMDQVPAWLANQPGDQPFTQGDVVKAATEKIVFAR